jgi:mono/diheme cytochrome c family protein
MPVFAALAGVDLGSITTHLGTLCTLNGRTGASLYAGNCSTCHGATAQGGQNGLGVSGPDIDCTEEHDYQEKVQYGDDEMPAFPALDAGDVSAIVTYVHGAFCAED